jgi:hypothetical protein
MNRFRIFSLVFLLAALCSIVVLAADPPADNMNILRDKIRADKKLIVAENMQLTESEAKAFWPLYDAYQAELDKINDRAKKAILMYAEAYNNYKVTDETAKKLIAEMLAIDEAELQLKKTFLPKLEAALPEVKVMRYLQLENKVRAILRYDLADGIPLAE